MNAKQRKVVRSIVNEMLKGEASTIAIRSTVNIIGEPIIEFQFNRVDMEKTQKLIDEIPHGLDFCRIH